VFIGTQTDTMTFTQKRSCKATSDCAMRFSDERHIEVVVPPVVDPNDQASSTVEPLPSTGSDLTCCNDCPTCRCCSEPGLGGSALSPAAIQKQSAVSLISSIEHMEDQMSSSASKFAKPRAFEPIRIGSCPCVNACQKYGQDPEPW
jgi:hypothetical protein